MTPNFFSIRERGQGDITPTFLGVNANSFKMVKATDFKFDRHLLMNKTNMTPIFSKRGMARVT